MKPCRNTHGGARPGTGPKRRSPLGSRTVAYELWPDHIRAVERLAKRLGISKSAAARLLIARGANLPLTETGHNRGC